MNQTDIDVILESFEMAPKKPEAVTSLAKLFHCDRDEIKKVLNDNGIEYPAKHKYVKKPKEKAVEAAAVETAAVEKTAESKTAEPAAAAPAKEDPFKVAKDLRGEPTLPMPDIVRNFLFYKIQNMEEDIGRAEKGLENMKAEYKIFKDWLFSSNGSGNLSQKD
jgi:hypothetical protein